MNFDDFKHRIGDHSAQEGADYLKFNQLGTQRRMAVMRGFEAYRMKKAAKGWGNVHTKDLKPSSRGPRGFVGAWRPTKTGTQRGEELRTTAGWVGWMWRMQIDIRDGKKRESGGRGGQGRGQE